MIRKGLLLLLLFFIGNFAFATDVTVRLLYDIPTKSFRFTTVVGAYKILDADNQFVLELNEKESVDIFVDGEEVGVLRNGAKIGSFSTISFDGQGAKAIFKISQYQGNEYDRFYDDHLEIGVENSHLVLINVVDLENYVAGVVQSEVHGSSDKLDFFKIQALITRTYVMSNMKKHAKEGFGVCDGVHCQAYKSRNNVPQILTAAIETAGMVIVDTAKNIITASFYSNSGGQTANSEDVWSMPVPYLRSIKDTFSLPMRNAYWEKKMPTSQWLSFLHKTYKYDINDPLKRDSALNFTQEERAVYFCGQIPLKFIRRDLNLKSAYFSVVQDGDEVTLKGRGYGHGVGLSQEGAINMINLGYGISEIINFYYTRVEISHIDQLPSDELGD